MRTSIKILFSTVGLFLLFVLGLNLLGTRTDIVDGVTGAKIKQIRPGWTLEQVITTLGRPYKIDALHGLHDSGCHHKKTRLEMDVNNTTDIELIVDNIYNDTTFCCEGNRQDLQNKEVTLIYTRPVNLSKHYPMLWVQLDSSFKVYSIYAKQYDGILGLDDPSIYSISWKLDSKTMTMNNEIEKFIDEPKYNDCFK